MPPCSPSVLRGIPLTGDCAEQAPGRRLRPEVANETVRLERPRRGVSPHTAGREYAQLPSLPMPFTCLQQELASDCGTSTDRRAVVARALNGLRFRRPGTGARRRLLHRAPAGPLLTCCRPASEPGAAPPGRRAGDGVASRCVTRSHRPTPGRSPDAGPYRQPPCSPAPRPSRTGKRQLPCLWSTLSRTLIRICTVVDSDVTRVVISLRRVLGTLGPLGWWRQRIGRTGASESTCRFPRLLGRCLRRGWPAHHAVDRGHVILAAAPPRRCSEFCGTCGGCRA